MKRDQTTGKVLARAMRLAPALRRGLRLTLLMAMAGQAIGGCRPALA